jgi:hypothetical protein
LDGAFEESDLRSGLRDGGQVLGAFIVARGEEEFVVYLRCNWIRGRGFRIIRTWRGSSGDRKFRNLQSAWGFVRKFDFLGRVTVYPVGDPELRGFMGVSPRDFGGSPFMHAAGAAAEGEFAPSAQHANPAEPAGPELAPE